MGSQGAPSNLQRNRRVGFKKCNRPNRRFSFVMPVSEFCYSQKDGRSSRYFESEENQCVHFDTTLSNGNPQCHYTESARSRLGSLDRSEGRLPSRAGSPPVQETVGFQIPRQGLAFRPKRLSVCLFERSSYRRSSPSPAGHPDILLSRRLASGGGVPDASPGPPSSHSSIVPEFGVHRQLGEVCAHPSEDARLPRSLSGYPQVDCPSGRAQSGGSSITHSGTYRVSGSSCSPVAEGPRTSGQFRGSGPELQASHAASSAALPSVLYSSVGLSVEADSFDSGNQGSVCSLGVSGSTSRRETFLPPPPHSLVLTSDASLSSWGLSSL